MAHAPFWFNFRHQKITLARRMLFWVQHGALQEARLPGGGLLYRRNEALPDNVVPTDEVICEDAEEEELSETRQATSAPAGPAGQPGDAHAATENEMKPYLQVRARLLVVLVLFFFLFKRMFQM